MSIRLLCCGVLVVGATLFGTSCAPTAKASQQTTPLKEETPPTFCGGFAGFACAEGYVCVDDPSDDCDPNQGGADCGGICQEAPRKTACDDPQRTYVSRDAEQCALLRFFCEDPKTVPFSDECGCGCERAK
ncbi:MAG TPA: hypothetical protein VEY88_19600 [Archangium sp.]|nr:hypothetical protein [Archangium sp.]